MQVVTNIDVNDSVHANASTNAIPLYNVIKTLSPSGSTVYAFLVDLGDLQLQVPISIMY